MYAALDGIVKKDAIFASNTSSISVTELLTATKRPERFIGLHFFQSRAADEAGGGGEDDCHRSAVYEAAYEFAKRLARFRCARRTRRDSS